MLAVHKVKQLFGIQLGASVGIDGCPSLVWKQGAVVGNASRLEVSLLKPVCCSRGQQHQPAHALASRILHN